ncbi:MAG TPA: SURF1 family protein [Anaerolineales bacterium]|nr:SURF1 family protein [Anaerolineales bacterium]
MNGPRRRTGLFLVLAALTAALFVRLGFWQLARHAERSQRNTAIQSSFARPQLLLPEQGPITEEYSYRLVRATGHFDPSNQILLMNRTYQERPGYHLVTPLLQEGNPPAVLVDRGWIPQEDATAERLESYRLDEAVSLSGLLLPSQREPAWSLLADPTPAPGESRQAWRALSIPTIQQQVPYKLAALYIEQAEPLAETGPAPIPAPELETSPGPHLGYAIQWFAFAAIAVGGALFWARRRTANRA